MARVTGAGAMVDFHSPDYDEDDEFDDTCIFRDEVFRSSRAVNRSQEIS